MVSKHTNKKKLCIMLGDMTIAQLVKTNQLSIILQILLVSL